MKLDIIFRTHDSGQRIESPRQKVANASKKEITLKCAQSLSNSIKQCKEEVNITILDDKSSKETIEKMESLFETDVTHFVGDFAEGSVNHFKHSRDSKADLIYSVEDDFLHKPEAIQELIDTYYNFVAVVKPEMICLYPDDDYFNYTNHFGPTKIVPGIGRPWRMHECTTNTFFTNPKVLRDYWEPFELLGSQCLTNPKICEDTTINVIWKYHVPLFTPLVPLAFHLDHHDPLFYKNQILELWKSIKV